MDIIGIICEYNPFHNGHLYHIEKIKKMFPHSLIVLALNGYFLERGEISLLTKEDKTKIALEHGVDLVLELPVLFGTQAADIFAESALTILNALGVEKLIFGSELNDLPTLKKIASFTQKEDYQIQVKKLLKTGVNYPTALALAIPSCTDFNHPNDLLAISYLKAIEQNHFPIEPISIKRTSNYHDTTSKASIVSASNIRNKLMKKEEIANYLPPYSKDRILRLDLQNYFYFLKAKILTTPHLESFLTVDEGIENRLIEKVKMSHSLEEFQKNIKTKRYTYNKMNRMFLHILLGITKEMNKNATISYIKVLGFNKQGQEYLKKRKKSLTIPILVDKNSLQYQLE